MNKSACDRPSARSISYIHHTNDYRQYCHVGYTAQHCRLRLFQDSDFAGDLEDSKSTSRGNLLCFQKSNIHSSDGLPALDLKDEVTEVLRSWKSTESPTHGAAGNCSRNRKSKSKQKGNRDVDQLSHVDNVTTNAHSHQGESQLYIFEDSEAVIKMIIKGRSPTVRHVSRTHRVALDWLFDRTYLEPRIQIKNVDTKNQLADMLTKGNFTRDECDHLLRMLNIMNFSMFSGSHLKQ